MLFTTLRLNRKYTAFPPHAVENEFPMSGGMQSGACVFLAIIIYSALRQRNQWSRRTPVDGHQSFHISLHFNAGVQKVLKSVLVVLVRLGEAMDKHQVEQRLPFAFLWLQEWTLVNEDAVITDMKPPGLFCLPFSSVADRRYSYLFSHIHLQGVTAQGGITGLATSACRY